MGEGKGRGEEMQRVRRRWREEMRKEKGVEGEKKVERVRREGKK